MRCRHSVDGASGAADIAVDMMDNASALPTCPQRQQQQKTALRKWAHTTSRRGGYFLLTLDGKSAERCILFANFECRLVVCAVVPSIQFVHVVPNLNSD